MDEYTVSTGLLAQACLLAAAIILGQWLARRKIQWFGEAAGAICLGVALGLLLHVCGAGSKFKDIVAFKGNFFLLALLPPIMFDAAYSMDVKLFINNIGAICAFAFAGTSISMLLIGLHMWLAGLWGLCYPLSLGKSLLFGAMISATDPVTVLAVFKRLGAQQDLHTVVFGESVLNDAVGMVLVQTIDSLLAETGPFSAVSVLRGLGIFCGIFLGSTVMGLLFGAAVALATRSGYFQHPTLEAGFVVVATYIAYLAAQSAHLSGIVAIIFAGMVMARYVRPNLSPEGAALLEAFFRVTATMAELFVFIYMGTLLFLQHQQWAQWSFMVMAVLALSHSRAGNIWPLAAAINYLRPPEHRISQRAQLMLWWSGLRGGMAFALSVTAAHKYGKEGEVMMTACFLICCLTVAVNGGGSAFLLRRLGLLDSEGAAGSHQAHGVYWKMATDEEHESVDGIPSAASSQDTDHTAARSPIHAEAPLLLQPPQQCLELPTQQLHHPDRPALLQHTPRNMYTHVEVRTGPRSDRPPPNEQMPSTIHTHSSQQQHTQTRCAVPHSAPVSPLHSQRGHGHPPAVQHLSPLERIRSANKGRLVEALTHLDEVLLGPMLTRGDSRDSEKGAGLEGHHSHSGQ